MHTSGGRAPVDSELGHSRVLLLHPAPLIAEALGARLRSHGLIVEVASPSTEVEVAHALGRFAPDLVVAASDPSLDADEAVRMPSVYSEAPTVVLVQHDDLWSAIRAIDAGALGFLTTAHSLEQLTAAVRRALAGKPVNSRQDLAALRRQQAMQDRERRGRMPGVRSLSPREEEILSDLMDGLTPDISARARGIAVSTVRTHIKGILTKLQVSSALEAVARARHVGWRPPREPDDQ